MGTPVEIEGASRLGTMVYNAWLTVQTQGEAGANSSLSRVRLAKGTAPFRGPLLPL